MKQHPQGKNKNAIAAKIVDPQAIFKKALPAGKNLSWIFKPCISIIWSML
jgi:hypothetical protein